MLLPYITLVFCNVVLGGKIEIFRQFAYLSVHNKIKAKQKRKINLISPELDRNKTWFYTFSFLFTSLSHDLHCTKLFLFFTMMLITIIFILKALLPSQVTFPKPTAEPSMYWLMNEISCPSKMQTDLDLALAEQKINPKPVEILPSLFLYHKLRTTWGIFMYMHIYSLMHFIMHNTNNWEKNFYYSSRFLFCQIVGGMYCSIFVCSMLSRV